MAATAPYHNAMRIGQGYNTYTHELRLDGAVKVASRTAANNAVEGSPGSAVTPAPAQSAGNNHAPVSRAAANSNGSSVPKADSTKDTSAPLTQADLPKLPDPLDSEDAAMVSRNDAATRAQMSSTDKGQLYSLPPGDPVHLRQSVTFSTRSISNMSDIMDALNISASMSIKYGTIHGNGSASFVNEDKVLDSQMNYLVSVRVNNNDSDETGDMDFQGIDSITPDKFTEVYGDCFIAGFETGGEFNAIISLDVHDKSKSEAVREAMDLQLAVPPVPGLEIGAGESFEKKHSELLRGIEMTISVNWTGGGELKPPGVPWTLNAVMAAANAYPSMIARSAARIAAILKPYTSLPSFVKWQYSQSDACDKKASEEKDEKKKATLEDFRDLWVDKALILNYAPCQLYTNDLFDAYMAYKKLWKRISFIMSDTRKWRPRSPKAVAKEIKPTAAVQDNNAVILRQPTRQNSKPETIAEEHEINGASQNPAAVPAPAQTAAKDWSATPTSAKSASGRPGGKSSIPPTPHVGSVSRFDTFPVNDPSIEEEWKLDDFNKKHDPISLDPYELNEARLLCREAMTLITEEAYSLVYHPDLAYADYNKDTKMTKMKRPIYSYPEVLMARLPVYIRNDAATNRRSRDPVILKLKQYDNNDLWANLVGDELNAQRTFTPFVSLERNENAPYENPIIALSLHAYSHSARYKFNHWWAESDRCIGGIGFRFENDKEEPEEDGCTQWEGHTCDDPKLYRKLSIRNRIKEMAKDAVKDVAHAEEKHHHGIDAMLDSFHGKSEAVKLDKDINAKPQKESFAEAAKNDRNITKIDIYHLPGSGRICGMVFHDAMGVTPLAWTQWETTSEPPSNVHHEEQYPPKDGNKWKFVGLMGDWDHGMLGHNKVLARVSGIWRRY